MPDTENLETAVAVHEETATPENNGLAINADTMPEQRRFAADSIRAPLPPSVYDRLGQLVIDEKAERILDEPLKSEEADILPDSGFVYAPWEYYARQLNRAFGRAGWTLIPGSPLAQEPGSNNYYRIWILFLGGVYYSEAMASRAYQPTNARMTLDDVAEAIRSDCLRRCCKPLGIARECFTKAWREQWRKEHAIQVVAPIWKGGQRVNGKCWRRKDGEPFEGELNPNQASRQPAVAPTAATKPAGVAQAEPPVRSGRDAGSTPAPSSKAQAPKPPAAAKPLTVVPDAKPEGPRLLDSQIRLLFARGRNAGMIVGDDATPMIEYLAEFGIADAVVMGKTSTESCTAMFKAVPPNQFTALVKKLDELAKAAKPESGDAERI